jgi:hypothetical protein
MRTHPPDVYPFGELSLSVFLQEFFSLVHVLLDGDPVTASVEYDTL